MNKTIQSIAQVNQADNFRFSENDLKDGGKRIFHKIPIKNEHFTDPATGTPPYFAHQKLGRKVHPL